MSNSIANTLTRNPNLELRPHSRPPSAIDPGVESLCDAGVDEMSWDDLSRDELDWPPVEELTEYRRQVYRGVRTLIETHPDLQPDHGPILPDTPLWALMMGFEHE